MGRRDLGKSKVKLSWVGDGGGWWMDVGGWRYERIAVTV